MSKQNEQRTYSRRRALALIGGGTAALTMVGCGSEDSPPKPELTPPSPQPKPSPVESATEPASTAETPPQQEVAAEAGSSSAADSGSLPKLDETSAQAQQLAYVHDASTLSAGPDTRYTAGQQCTNCALYQGGDAEWGGCPLFQGRRVKGTGWCSAYSPAG